MLFLIINLYIMGIIFELCSGLWSDLVTAETSTFSVIALFILSPLIFLAAVTEITLSLIFPDYDP